MDTKHYSSKNIRDMAKKAQKKSTKKKADLEVVKNPGELAYWSEFQQSVGDEVLVTLPYTKDESELEAQRLCETLGLNVQDIMFFDDRKIEAATYITQGHLSKIKARAEGLSGVVIDAPLKPSQIRNIEKYLGLPVIDREGLILSIFRSHAQTRLAQTQVELAQLKYLLPRLAGLWMGLSRQRGGRGGLKGRGLGETRLELDRRVVKERITFLTKKVKEAEKSFAVQSSRREALPRVALVGYTNAGKSTLMNAMTRSKLKVEDKLFATLDTTVRPLLPPTQPKILISDTVGFVRDLPHGLVASFKSTLAEALGSKLLLHVVDSSHPEWMQHFETTEKVLEEIGGTQIRRVLVLNKIDATDLMPRVRESQSKRLLREKESYVGVISVSAVTGEGLPELHKLLMKELGAKTPAWLDPSAWDTTEVSDG